MHRACLDAGDPARAARSGFWLGLSFLLQGEAGAAAAWLVEGAAADPGRDCVEQGYLLLPLAEQQLAQGRADESLGTAGRAARDR